MVLKWVPEEGQTQESCWNYIFCGIKKNLSPIKANSWVAYKKNKLIWMIKILKHNWLILHVNFFTPFPPVWQDDYIYLNVLISETCFAQQRQQTFSDSASGFIVHSHSHSLESRTFGVNIKMHRSINSLSFKHGSYHRHGYCWAWSRGQGYS